MCVIVTTYVNWHRENFRLDRENTGNLKIQFEWVPCIREIPDHATFREKEDTLGWLDKLGGFLSLALCNLANFDQLYLPRNRKYHSS